MLKIDNIEGGEDEIEVLKIPRKKIRNVRLSVKLKRSKKRRKVSFYVKPKRSGKRKKVSFMARW